MAKENTREELLQQCVAPGIVQAEPPQAAVEYLPVPQGLARGSTDGGSCPTSISLMPTPSMAQGGHCVGGLP